MKDLDAVDIDCPHDGCTARIKTTLTKWSRGGTATCSSGHEVNLDDRTGDARRVATAADDLGRQLKRMGFK